MSSVDEKSTSDKLPNQVAMLSSDTLDSSVRLIAPPSAVLFGNEKSMTLDMYAVTRRCLQVYLKFAG